MSQFGKQIRVVVNGSSAWGREYLRGVMRYARAEAHWKLCVELQVEGPKRQDWDDDEGMLFAETRGRELLERLANRSAPIVLSRAHFQDMGLPTVRVDDRAIGRIAAEHFLERGFERFIFVSGGDRSLASTLRESGFREALATRHHDVLIPEYNAHQQWYVWRGLIQLIRASGPRRPTAVFFSHDTLGRAVADYLASAGIVVPEQAAMLGVDNDELECEICVPPLSSIETDAETVGLESARLLQRLLDGRTPPRRPKLIPPIGVVTRESTDSIAVDDPRLSSATQYMRNHACDPCSIDEVLEHVGVSRRWLEIRFQDQFGHTPQQELRRLRIERARSLLRSTRTPMHLVARRCGYNLVQTFGRAFRQTTGETPATYRRRFQPDPRYR